MLKILFITKSPPYPPTIGGNQRNNLIYQALSRLGEVDLFLALCPSDFPEHHLQILRRDFRLIGCEAPSPSGARGPWRAMRFFAPRAVDFLSHHLGRRSLDYLPDPILSGAASRLLNGRQYDVVVGQPLRILAKAGLESFHPVILDVIDLDMEFYQSRTDAYYLPWWERLGARFHLRQLETIVPPIIRRFDAVWFANPEDSKSVAARNGRVLPNIPFPRKGRSIEPMAPVDEKNKTLLTVGTLSYRPNKDGIDLFLKESWPIILHSVPDARFMIVGSGLSEKQRDLWRKHRHVDVLGFIDDLSEVYGGCAFTVAPVFWGAGTNIKVLESLAYGRAAAVTRFAHRGYEDTLRPMESLVVADDTKTLAEACVTLLKDPGLRNRLAASGRQMIAKSYSFEHFCRIVRETMDEALILGGKSQ